MVSACSLITCEHGKFSEVVNKLTNLRQIKRVFSVHGKWDVVADIETEDLNEVSVLVLQLSNLDGVISSNTLIGFGEDEN
jgi:DNA-binding Lrp family transcriptional regulator